MEAPWKEERGMTRGNEHKRTRALFGDHRLHQASTGFCTDTRRCMVKAAHGLMMRLFSPDGGWKNGVKNESATLVPNGGQDLGAQEGMIIKVRHHPQHRSHGVRNI